MKSPNIFYRVLMAACFSVAPALCQAVEYDEIRPYEEVYRISGKSLSEDLVEVRWDIEPGYFLYANKFLKVISKTPGVTLDEMIVPEGKKEFDALLGQEVVKFHRQMTVSVPLASVEAGVEELQLRVRSQGCLEDVLCYPPTYQEVTIALATPSSVGLTGLPDAGAILPLDLSSEGGLLSAEQAFSLQAIGFDAETILVRAAPVAGHYLYRDKFVFIIESGDGVSIRQVDLPAGVIKDDPEFGPVPVYFDSVDIPLRLNRPAGPERRLLLGVAYQGCKDGEICYPPQSIMLELDLPGSAVGIDQAVTHQAAAPPVSEQDRLARLLTSNPPGAVLAFFFAGLLLAFTPCVFPMVPILSGLIAGQGDRLTTTRAFSLSVVYVLAMSLTYTLAGVLAGLFGQNLQAVFQNPWIIVGFVGVFIALALSMFGLYELQLPSRWQTALSARSNQQKGGNWTGVAVMGFLSALIVGPCVAPPLAAALIVIGASGSALLGGLALFALSLGMGVPLILFGISAGKLIPRAGAWMDGVKAFFGVGLLALGVWMLERILPGGVIMLLWGALGIGCAVYLGALDRLDPEDSGWQRLRRVLGLILLVLGAIQLVGAASGGDRWTQPLYHLKGGGSATEQAHPEFQRVKSIADLEQALAQSGGTPAMFDFYADWCVECIRMERRTFPDPVVAELMERFRLLQADVTPNDDVDQALMRKFDIIGPPAILFFDGAGREMKNYRLVGYFTPDEFSEHLQRVLSAP